MREQVDAPRTPLVDRYHLCFALGKALEDRGEYAESFQLLRAGQCAQEGGVPLPARSAGAHGATGRSSSARASSSSSAQATAATIPSPIFIVGLPRAGSTLLEQILASHSQVEGTMELADIPRLVSALDLHASGARYPGVLAAAVGGRVPRLRRGLHPRHAALPRRQQAVLHRQDAEQLPPRRPDPPDAAEREDHRRAPRTDGLLLQQLQAAVRAAASSSPTASRTSARYYRTVRAADGSLGLGAAGSRPARAARGRHRGPRGQRAADPRFLRAASSSRPASSSTRPSGACTPRVPSRCAGRSIARAWTSGATSSRGWARCARRWDRSRQPRTRRPMFGNR